MPRGICPGVGLGRAERARRRALRTLHPAPRTPHPAGAAKQPSVLAVAAAQLPLREGTDTY